MKQKTIKNIFNTVVGLLILAGLVWVCSRFVHLGKVEYTDNAQVRQLIVPINSRVQGFVKAVRFEEYQTVHKGDTLLLIDDAEFRYRLAQADADYQNALTGRAATATTVHTSQSNISVSAAGVAEAKARYEQAEREYRRYSALLQQDAVTRQQYDAVRTDYESAKARYDLTAQQKESSTLASHEQSQRLQQSDAGVKLAEAALEIAKLNLSYTVIIAPCNGTTGRKNLQVGQLVQPGQTLVEVVDANDKWVVANYKETQTTNITVGQPVTVKVDAVQNIEYKGVVRSISRATGASFSLLPQDNSAGNFVKVEQRIPVRVDFTASNDTAAMRRLRSGMNVECTVHYGKE